MTAFSPREIVSELDRFIVGQADANAQSLEGVLKAIQDADNARVAAAAAAAAAEAAAKKK